MKNKCYIVTELPDPLVIGRRTETGVLDVRIDCTSWLSYWPKLSLSVWVTPPGGSAAYPAATHMEGAVLVWRVNSGDTAVEGFGTMEVVGVAPGQKKLSAITKTQVLRTTTTATTEPPEAAQVWVDQVLTQTSANVAAAQAAAASANRDRQAAEQYAKEAATSSDWSKITSKPEAFPPESHTHAQSDILGLNIAMQQRDRVWNLLNNSDFRNPVNQRGQTSYSVTLDYAIDSWRGAPSVLSLNSNYISVSRGSSSYAIFAQFTPNAKEGITYTLAAQTAEGEIATLTFAFAVGMSNVAKNFSTAGHSIIARYSTVAEAFYVGLSNTTDIPLNVVWMALYEGEYTADTLPTYQPERYATELLECYRHFYKSPPSGTVQGHGMVSSTLTRALIAIPLPVRMRVTPSIKVINPGQVRAGGTAATVTEMAVSRMDNNVVLLNVTVDTSLPANQTAVLVNASFELDANL